MSSSSSIPIFRNWSNYIQIFGGTCSFFIPAEMSSFRTSSFAFLSWTSSLRRSFFFSFCLCLALSVWFFWRSLYFSLRLCFTSVLCMYSAFRFRFLSRRVSASNLGFLFLLLLIICSCCTPSPSLDSFLLFTSNKIRSNYNDVVINKKKESC